MKININESEVMEQCSSFQSCNAPLCPLDPKLHNRIWYVGEDICQGRPGAGVRWIKKQRSVTRKQTASYLGKPIQVELLIKNSQPKTITDEQRLAMSERLKSFRKQNETQ